MIIITTVTWIAVDIGLFHTTFKKCARGLDGRIVLYTWRRKRNFFQGEFSTLESKPKGVLRRGLEQRVAKQSLKLNNCWVATRWDAYFLVFTQGVHENI